MSCKRRKNTRVELEAVYALAVVRKVAVFLYQLRQAIRVFAPMLHVLIIPVIRDVS